VAKRAATNNNMMSTIKNCKVPSSCGVSL